MPNSTINATTNGLNSTAGNVATLDLQVAGSTVASATSGGVAITGTLSASGATTLSGAVSASSLSVNSNNISADNSLGFRNRIINGDMRIDQRNAGATVTATQTYPVDRFEQEWSGVGVLTSKRSTDAPEGFTNSVEVKVTTIDSSIGSTDFYQISQFIEGFNVADIGFGQSWCKPISLSFWVKASQTGTYSVQLANSGGSRCYPTTITVSSANTWEYKTISVPATTTGSFNTDNTSGLELRIGFAYGSNFDGATANTWGTFTSFADSFVAPTTNMMATLNATFYITGVQLEVGSTATPFERRPYGTELALCQRYFYSFDTTTLYAHPGSALVANNSSTRFYFPTTMRATPTGTYTGTVGSDSSAWTLYNNGNYRTVSALSISNLNKNSMRMEVTTSSGVAASDAVLIYCFDNNGGASLTASAEL